MARKGRLAALLLGLWLACSTVYGGQETLCAADWEQYRQRFMTSEGRIQDTGNGGISHSEGQGWGMLLAVAADDQEAFQKLWDWTDIMLRRPDMALFSWRYDPRTEPAVADPNNASDGDVLIAWALLRAGQRWGNTDYLAQSAMIREAISKRLVRRVQGYTTLLPGIEGFDQPGGTLINLSYLVIPAFAEFDRIDPRGPWKDLLDDAPRLLKLARYGRYDLPPDWLMLPKQGKPYPASGWPARFGFDAVRIPLYYRWGRMDQRDPALLRPFERFWRSGGQGNPPAWIDLDDGSVAPYPVSTGVLAIRAYLAGAALPESPVHAEDYYSASLYLLVQLASGACGQRPQSG